MTLKELLAGLDILSSSADLNTDIHEVQYDSRLVEPGDLFIAVPGAAADGQSRRVSATKPAVASPSMSVESASNTSAKPSRAMRSFSSPRRSRSGPMRRAGESLPPSTW